MKKHSIVISAFCLSLLAGCQQSEYELGVDKECLVSIEASIGGAGASRYAGNDPNGAVFANGDKIGLAYRVGIGEATGFVKWTFNGSDWTAGSSMTWKNLGEDHTFYAFYPYGENNVNSTVDQIKMPILTEQNGGMSSVAACDFLVATKTMKYSNEGKVSFTGTNAFKHVSSLVVLKLKNAGDLVSATIKNISLIGADLVTGSDYSFTATDGKKVMLEDGLDDAILSVDFTDGVEMDEDKVFYFVVNSGTVDLEDVDLCITYESAGDEIFTAKKEGLNKQDGHTLFQEGYFYNYNITVTTDKNLLISGYEIDKWNEGSSMDITIDSEKTGGKNEN